MWCIIFNIHQNFSSAKNVDALIQLVISFFLFSATSFLFILLWADLWPFPLVCPNLPFWDIILLLMLPGENITLSQPSMWVWVIDNCADHAALPAIIDVHTLTRALCMFLGMNAGALELCSQVELSAVIMLLTPFLLACIWLCLDHNFKSWGLLY